MMKRIGFGRISCGSDRLDLQNKLKVVCDYSADVGSPQNKSMPEMYFSYDDWYYAKKES